MKNRHVLIETTLGEVELEMFEDKMPITTTNFIQLVEKGYYNGIIFHRVIPNFMVQGGDPKGDGTGGPGYEIADEFVEGLSNVRGTISMANAGPNTGGSQFFINVKDNTNLDFNKPPFQSKHPVFGKVVKGMDVVDKIVNVKRDGRDKPLNDVVMKTLEIVG